MHKKLVAVVSTAAVIAGLALTGSAAHAVTATSIAGKGSSFANNALQYCLSHYDPASNDTVSYTSTGSGTGRSEMAAGNVKWAASDGLYGASDAQPASYTMVPILGGPVVFAYNASSGIPAGLKLDAATVSGILKGDIKTWNAYAIKKLNPGHPDRLHFHSLVKQRYVRRWFPNASADIRNSITGVLVGFMTLTAIVLASETQASVLGSALAFVALGLGYVSLYARMVRFHWCSPIEFLLVKPAFKA